MAEEPDDRDAPSGVPFSGQAGLDEEHLVHLAEHWADDDVPSWPGEAYGNNEAGSLVLSPTQESGRAAPGPTGSRDTGCSASPPPFPWPWGRG